MMELTVEDVVLELKPELLLQLSSSCSQHSQDPPLTNEQACTLFHKAVDAMIKRPNDIQNGAQMVYLLRNMGAQINRQDQAGSTPLLRYLKSSVPHPEIVEAFLRCNADVYLTNKDGAYPLEVVTRSHTISSAVRDVFMKYVPGIWEAVEGDDPMNVRKLINEWCRVDVQKNGQTLLHLSLEKGTEGIIRLVSGIRPTMEFAHSVLAGDVLIARKILKLSQKLKINVNLRNLGDRGATPLFYALKQGNLPMVQLLLEYGARIDITMKGEGESEIPLYIAVLGLKPPVSIPLMKSITHIGQIPVDSLFYQGKNVLFHCIDNNIDKEVIDYILEKGSAYLVTQRIENNFCVRDYAEQMACHKMISAIDDAVFRWLFIECGTNRKILILQGYEYVPSSMPSSLEKTDKNVKSTESFYKCLPKYQAQIKQLHKAVNNCDVETVRQILYFVQSEPHGLDPCLADCRKSGDGQPLLHKAVLRGSFQMVQLLAETLVYQRKQRLDTIRDQFFRTALHYAYGKTNAKPLVDLLLDYGASEFTMDKDSRSPLAFKDRQGQPLMEKLLEYQLHQTMIVELYQCSSKNNIATTCLQLLEDNKGGPLLMI